MKHYMLIVTYEDETEVLFFDLMRYMLEAKRIIDNMPNVSCEVYARIADDNDEEHYKYLFN